MGAHKGYGACGGGHVLPVVPTQIGVPKGVHLGGPKGAQRSRSTAHLGIGSKKGPF